MLWFLSIMLVASLALNVLFYIRLQRSTKIINNVIQTTTTLMEMTDVISDQLAELKEPKISEVGNGD